MQCTQLTQGQQSSWECRTVHCRELGLQTGSGCYTPGTASSLPLPARSLTETSSHTPRTSFSEWCALTTGFHSADYPTLCANTQGRPHNRKVTMAAYIPGRTTATGMHLNTPHYNGHLCRHTCTHAHTTRHDTWTRHTNKYTNQGIPLRCTSASPALPLRSQTQTVRPCRPASL